MFPGPSTGPDLVLWYQVDQLAGRLFRVFLSILNHLVIAYNPQVVPPIPLPVYLLLTPWGQGLSSHLCAQPLMLSTDTHGFMSFNCEPYSGTAKQAQILPLLLSCE